MVNTSLLGSIAIEAIAWRRQLHEHPETMYEEFYISDFVQAKLTEWRIPYEIGFAKTGIVATVYGHSGASGQAIALRADMDALPITEISDSAWCSTNPGKMHACGHDGHTATLLAVAKYLSLTRQFAGCVRLIFQPAEEGGGGASQMLQDNLIGRFPFREIYSFHNWPGLPLGQCAMRPGPVMAAVDIFRIDLEGEGGHAGMPHISRDVVPATAHLILALQHIVSRELDPHAKAVLSVTNVHAGSGADNVISGTSYITGTVRTYDKAIRDLIETRITSMARGLALTYGVVSLVNYKRLVNPVINDASCTAHCREAASLVFGEENVKLFDPVMAGEDFGDFLTQTPGSIVMIGQRSMEPNSPHNNELHSPRYDFNDDVIILASEYLLELVQTRLSE